MSTSPKAPPTVRQSVYWLSVLAAKLQAQQATTSDDTSRNTRVKRATAPNSNTRSLNHLAALLTRGSTRVVAVTSGPFQESSIHLSVFASPATSLTVSPSSSSSSGVADCPASAPSPSSDVPPDGTTAATMVDRKVASMVVTRNSLSGDELGGCTSFIVPMASVEPLLDIILAAPRSFTPQPIPFTQYAEQSLSLIRAATSRMATDSSCRNAAMNGVCTFFVASCRSKLRARTNKFWRLYVNEDLREWTPAQETITELDITIHHPIIASQLKKAGILPTSGSSTTGFSFPFTLATVAAWWTTLLHLLNYFKTVVRNKSKPALLIAMASIQFHILLHNLPESFWALQSLNTHLRQRQKGKSRHHAEFVSIGVDEVRADQKDDDDDDDDPMEDSLADNPLMDSSAAPHSASFRRMADALSAWTTGTQFLLNGRLSRVSAPIHVSVVDLPRAPIPAVDVDTLFHDWTTKAGWSTQIGETILSAMQKINLDLSPRACHCEAGLMASFLLHSHLPLKDGDSEGKWKEQAALEPAVLSGAFETQGMTGEHAIGVAKKCCPLCRMLGDVLEEKHGLRVALPGQHTSFFPWVPPSWLHPDALREMERRLIDVVTEMVNKDIFKSHTSSSASDPGDQDLNISPNTDEYLMLDEDISQWEIDAD